MSALPEGARRLFDPGPAPDETAGEALVIGRLLEDGDGRDLAWLAGRYGEERLAAWLRLRGARQLSARSRAFWRRVLAVPEVAEGPGAEALWPR